MCPTFSAIAGKRLIERASLKAISRKFVIEFPVLRDDGVAPLRRPATAQTERVSWAIAKQVVEKCDYLIDLHGDDLYENLRHYSKLATTGKEAQDAMARAMVLAFGLDHISLQDFRTPVAPGRAVTTEGGRS